VPTLISTNEMVGEAVGESVVGTSVGADVGVPMPPDAPDVPGPPAEAAGSPLPLSLPPPRVKATVTATTTARMKRTKAPTTYPRRLFAGSFFSAVHRYGVVYARKVRQWGVSEGWVRESRVNV
jgi:hypothetical protein